MKKKVIAAVVVMAVGSFAFFSLYLASYYFSWRSDYNEAEPLAEIIWPLSEEMKKFENKNGRRANSLTEILLPDSDLSALYPLKHEFYQDGPIAFEVIINESYGFEINSDYAPSWVYRK